MSADRPHVCVVGSSNVDLTFRTPRLPRPGETIGGRLFHLGFGGKGANQAVMAARLGARVTMVGKVGRDLFGEHVLQNYREQGIDTTHVRTDPDGLTGTAAILVDDRGQNAIIVIPGANSALSPAEVREAAPAIQAADAVLCQLEVPLETTAEALRIARSAGVRTIFNPAPAVALPRELFPLADLCVPNETEAELLTGQRVTNAADAEVAGLAIRQRGAVTVIVTLGQHGALIVAEDAAELIPAVPVEAVDSAGAGDAFIGSLAVFLAEGLPRSQAVRRANAVAALSVRRLGTQASFPSRREAEAFWTEHRVG